MSVDSTRLTLDTASLRALESAQASLAQRASAASGAQGSTRDEKQAARVATDLESVFATMLVKEMRRGMAEGFFGEGASGDVYGGWFDEHIGRALGEAGALDLAGLIKSGLPEHDAPAIAETGVPARAAKAPRSTR